MKSETTQERVSDTLDPFVLLKAVHDYHEARRIGPHQDAPGHCHNVPGRWDKDGSPCDWCETWNRVRECVKQDIPLNVKGKEGE